MHQIVAQWNHPRWGIGIRKENFGTWCYLFTVLNSGLFFATVGRRSAEQLLSCCVVWTQEVTAGTGRWMSTTGAWQLTVNILRRSSSSCASDHGLLFGRRSTATTSVANRTAACRSSTRTSTEPRSGNTEVRRLAAAHAATIERPHSRSHRPYSNVLADREFSAGCYLLV